MSRWIDADALHDALKAKQKWVVRCGDKHNEGYTYDQVHFAIDDAPTIEAVSIDDYRSMENTCYKLQKALYEMADRKTENSSEKPNNSDTISRRAAISAICNACGKIDCDKMDKCEKLQLPPANCSEFPNNCEHITEDGVTCAKYPACDDCLDNPLNKVKGSERFVKGSEQTEPTISKMEQVEDEPQTDGILFKGNLKEGDYKLIKTINGWVLEGNDIAYYGEPQTERSE